MGILMKTTPCPLLKNEGVYRISDYRCGAVPADGGPALLCRDNSRVVQRDFLSFRAILESPLQNRTMRFLRLPSGGLLGMTVLPQTKNPANAGLFAFLSG